MKQQNLRFSVLWVFFVTLQTTALAWELKEAPPSFFKAIVKGDIAEVIKQLDSGISVDAVNEDGVNALYLACDKEQPAIATLLLDRGANVNLTPPHGSTALQISIYRGFDAYLLKPKPGYPELQQKLLAKGANVNSVDVNGNTALIAAAEKDDVVMLKELLQRGAALAHINNDGWTALERAVSFRRRTIAQELVAAGAPLDDKQKQMLQDYHFARRAGAAFPIIVVGSFLLAAFLHKRFKDLPKRQAAPRMGDDLPKLQSLKCHACGGSASLRPGKATCSHCHEPVPVPQDYTRTLKLREQSFKLMAKAVVLWKRVRVISAFPLRWALWIAAIWFVWRMSRGIFPHFIRDAFYNFMTFSGTMLWALDVLAMTAIAIALIGYAIYLAIVRSEIPIITPIPEAHLGQAETLPCQNCGGMVDHAPKDLVGICGYCGGETYRVALARKAKGVAEQQKDDASQSLYQAMVRVYELRENAALAVPFAILAIGFALVIILRIALALV